MIKSKSSLRRLGIFAVAGIMCTVAFVMLDQPSGMVDKRLTPSGSDPNLQATSHRPRLRYGSMASLPVDPASVDPEGNEPDDWDELSTTERISRTERAVADTLREMKSAAPDDVERHRQRAFMTLSAARADFFATKSGTERYEQLERELEEQ
jgi:hypothetical protein